MAMPTASLSVLFVAIVLCSMVAISDSMSTGLRLNSYSEEQVDGCYIHNQTLGICFDAQKDSIKIAKTTGEELVVYLKFDKDMFYYQILDQGFIGYGPSMFYVPDDVSRNPDALRAFVRNKAEDEIAQQADMKNHYQAAISELHYVPEVQLLERVSAALGDNSTRLEILQLFHGLCLNLLKAAEVKIPDELRAAPGMEDETADQHNREKRCSRPRANNCLGMCGPGCMCWSWYCGNCCWHRGCYEHDLCCKKSRFSSYCLTPPGCSSFSGYPKCLRRSGWWRR